MPLRRTCEVRKNPAVVADPSYCFSLIPVIEWIDARMKDLNLSARFSFDPTLLTTAALNHVFYGTVSRGDKYYRVLSELELLGVPTDIAHELYQYTHNWIKTQVKSYVGVDVNYTCYGFTFMTDSDVIIMPVPLHSIPRHPVYD